MMEFVDANYFASVDGPGGGSWQPLAGTSFNSRPVDFGIEVLGNNRFDIWDRRCS